MQIDCNAHWFCIMQVEWNPYQYDEHNNHDRDAAIQNRILGQNARKRAYIMVSTDVYIRVLYDFVRAHTCICTSSVCIKYIGAHENIYSFWLASSSRYVCTERFPSYLPFPFFRCNAKQKSESTRSNNTTHKKRREQHWTLMMMLKSFSVSVERAHTQTHITLKAGR